MEVGYTNEYPYYTTPYIPPGSPRLDHQTILHSRKLVVKRILLKVVQTLHKDPLTYASSSHNLHTMYLIAIYLGSIHQNIHTKCTT